MITRCKFKCIEVSKSEYWGIKGEFLYSTKFDVVTSGTPENKDFWAATPSGHLTVSTIKKDCFVPGKEYYIDILEAEN